MKNTILSLTIIIVISTSCKQEKSALSILNDVQQKIEMNNLANYQHVALWDSRFNDTEFHDTSYIEREKSIDNIHGFLYTESRSTSTSYYDGSIMKEMEHDKRRTINHDPDEISADSSYFESRMSLMAQPIFFLDIDSSYVLKDSIIDRKPTLMFTTSKESIHDDKQITRITNYLIDKEKVEPWQIQTISIADKDTTQIITHTFKDLHLSNETIDFAKIRSSVMELGYAEINFNQVWGEMHKDLIAQGAKLPQMSYTNVNDEETKLFGTQDRRSVIMMSFIGCGGCEYAMKEMKKKDFNFQEDVDFYYSSPLDKNSTLQSYLLRKSFEGIGFGKESMMNEDLKAYSFPTFIIVDSSGTVTDVFQGYSQEVEGKLF